MTNDWGWAGGGGGGGRVKVFSTSDGFAGTLAVTAGAGGTTCAMANCYAGTAGSIGTTNRTTVPQAFQLIMCAGQ